MNTVYPVVLALLCALFCHPSSASAQNFSIGYQLPDHLVVCEADTLTVTVQNLTGAPIVAAQLNLDLPSGLEYLPASVSGATELNISNLQKPVWTLAPLPIAGTVQVQLLIRAGCGLIEAINSGQLFSALLRVQAGPLSEQVTTASFPVQTGLLVITQLDGDSLAGEKGEVLLRTLHVQNTRLGVVRHLTLHDAHQGGLSIHVPGAASETNLPTAFTAVLDGSFFTAFGDGDDLLEFGEEILIQEEITVTDCGIPPHVSRSNISTAWGCTPDAPTCQADSTRAKVLIKTSTDVPKLTFSPTYGLPWDMCAGVPSDMRLHIVNIGKASAQGIILTLNSVVPDYLGMEPTSFRLSKNGLETPVTLNLTEPATMPSCGVTFAGGVTLVIPEVAAFDSVDLVFNVFYCRDFPCQQPLPIIECNYFYAKPCPVNGFEVGSVSLAPGINDLWKAQTVYNIGECLQDGKTYNFEYQFTSDRVLSDTGFVWLRFDLPKGLWWNGDCAPKIGNVLPVHYTTDPAFTTYDITRVLLAFPLPLPKDSVLHYCLRAVCDTANSYVHIAGATTPDANGDFEIYDADGPACTPCGFEVKTTALLTLGLNSDLGCAVMSCDSFKLATVCTCSFGGGSGGNGSGGGGNVCFSLRNHYQAARLNYDLADNDDNRQADAAGLIDLTKVRRDRFIPGDTLQAILSTKVVCGDSIKNLYYQLFTETVRSDIPLNGANDTFLIKQSAAREMLANKDSFSIVGIHITVFDSMANTAYSCDIDPGSLPLLYERLYGRISQVNTKPPKVKDEMVTMDYQVEARMDQLPCLPPGFLLDGGDSVEVRVDYKLRFNFLPTYPHQHKPPLINFEMGFNLNGSLGEFYNYRRYDTLMFQYSGFLDTIGYATYGIKPCTNSNEIKPFVYGIRLARENLFPFEVRPLTRIADYGLFMPYPFVPLSATLKYLRLQENVPVFQNQPIAFSVVDTVLHLDFSPFYVSPLDEGYKLETSLVFPPECAFKAPDSSAQRLILAYPGCMKMPNPDTVVFRNKLGFLSSQPRDTLLTNELILDFPTGDVSADVLLKNLAPIAGPNYWVQLVSVEGGLTDLALYQMPQNTLISSTNGLFQLGTLGPVAEQNLRIRGRNLTCQPQHLLIRYGWDCQPHIQPGAPSCAEDSLIVLFQPLNPELELDLSGLPEEIPLCDTSAYFQFEMSNADLGFAYSPFVNVELPPGISIVPGSCQIAYPAGSAFLPLPDPQAMGNLFEWNLAVLQAQLGADGLPGVDQEPKNTVQIRFRLQAVCGAVSNAQLVFGTRAKQYCGLSTNVLRKAGDPVLIEGLTPAYGVQIGLSEMSGSGGPIGCSEERTVQVNLQIGGVAQAGDSIYLDLPAGFVYVDGSYQAGSNAPAGPPQLTASGLQLPLPGGLPPNTGLSFSVKMISPALPNCSGATLHAQTRQRTSAFCAIINTDCTVYIATGEAIYPFVPHDPEVVITGASISVSADGTATYTATLANQGGEAASPNLIQFYRDVDGDGQLSAADTLLHAAPLMVTIGPAGTFLFADNGAPNPDELCHLLAVLPAAENCDCEPSVYPVQADLIAYAPQVICLGNQVTVGLDSIAGHAYQWLGQPPGPCGTCPQSVVSPTATGQYLFTLTDETPNCKVTHNFPVLVNPLPQGLGPDTTTCDNHPVLLATGPAVAWHWAGPGVTNPAASTQLVQPAENATYAVTVTNAAGCTLVDAVSIAVLPSDSIDLGTRKTCAGTPVDVFGQMTETPGTYCHVFPKSNGCDSTVCLVLQIVPGTSETLPRCPGDTVLVFGTPVHAAGTYCQNFPSSLGCDSMHCIVVQDLPAIQVKAFDTVYVASSGSVVLEGPPGFATYAWSPAEGLSCTDCQSPVAMPTDTTAYLLTVTNDNGCSALLHFLLLPFPPCDPARLEIPNAITPDGDGVNDVFRVVPFEGVEVISRLQVYDRWGAKVYEGTGVGAAWDGKIDGQPAPSDVYVWILEVECSGDREKRVGDVTVVR